MEHNQLSLFYVNVAAPCCNRKEAVIREKQTGRKDEGTEIEVMWYYT